MKIIYHCFGGSHSSVLAASLHLGLINKNKLPTKDEMLALPVFDKTTDRDFGIIRFMGEDEFNNYIYVLGKKDLGDRYTKLLKGVAYILGVEKELLVVNTMTRVNWFMKIGGYLSRKLGLVKLGQFFLEWGIRQCFFEIVNLVEITKIKGSNKV